MYLVIFSTILFALLIVSSNYLVQFPLNDFLTYGALTYPFTFLLSDVLSEHYDRKRVLNIVRVGIILAFIPSYLLAEPRIAIASVGAFFFSQQIDVYAFYWIKSKFPKLWWFRSAGSTAFSQFIDTIIFFHVAFLFEMPWESILMLSIGDYTVKLIFAFLNTPFFYLFAIKMRRFFGFY